MGTLHDRHPKWLPWLLALVLALAAVATAFGAGAASREFNAAIAARPHLDNGAAHFETCSACHGGNGGGADNGTVPAIAGQHFRALVKQLVDFRHNARWDIRMEHFVDRHHLKDAQAVADVARYIASLPRDFRVGTGDGSALERGRELFRARCAGCHGAGGEGSDATRMPRLAGQHQAYLVRQMQDAADNRRPNMQGQHAVLARSMTLAEFQAIGDYLSRLAAR